MEILKTEPLSSSKKVSRSNTLHSNTEEPVDWSGQKYVLLKDKGYDVNMYFNRIAYSPNGLVSNEWFSRCHSKSDGVGAFSDLQTNLTGIKWEQPHNQKISKPTKSKRAWQLMKYLWSSRPIEYNWINDRSSINNGDEDAVATICFSEKSTDQLLAWTKQNKISLNSLLLWSLDSITRLLLLTDNHTRAWLIPVNMRGGIPLSNPSFNYTASLNLRLENNDSVTELDQGIKRLYAQGQQWGSWVYSNFSQYIPAPWIKRIFKNYKSCWLGVFSNLGSWSDTAFPHQSTTMESVHWSAISPSTPFNPVAVVALTWNNQLTLSLRIHPSKLKGHNINQEVSAFANQWRQFLTDHCQLTNDIKIQTTNFKDISQNCLEF